MSSLLVGTPCGDIKLRLRPDAAPTTVEYITRLVKMGLYNGKSFYRSDFVIQMGLHPQACPEPNLAVNEAKLEPRLSNTRGTAAVAHWDVPDCGELPCMSAVVVPMSHGSHFSLLTKECVVRTAGNSEFFINLKTNDHLDEAYGGYCVSERARCHAWTASDRARAHAGAGVCAGR